MTCPQPVPKQRSWNPPDFHKFHDIHKKKDKLLEKSELLDKRGFELTEKRKDYSLLQPTRTYNLSMPSMVWNISIGQFGCLSGCAPSQLLHSCSLAEYEKPEKSPCFLSNNCKHQCYRRSSRTKSKTQRLLGRKLTLSQPKPGQSLRKEPRLGWRQLGLGWWNQLFKSCSFCQSLIEATFGRVIQHQFPCAIDQSWSPLLYSTSEEQLVASRQMIPSQSRTGKQSPVRQLQTHFTEHMLDYSTARRAHICLCLLSVLGPFDTHGDVSSAACLRGQPWRQASRRA